MTMYVLDIQDDGLGIMSEYVEYYANTSKEAYAKFREDYPNARFYGIFVDCGLSASDLESE